MKYPDWHYWQEDGELHKIQPTIVAEHSSHVLPDGEKNPTSQRSHVVEFEHSTQPDMAALQS